MNGLKICRPHGSPSWIAEVRGNFLDLAYILQHQEVLVNISGTFSTPEAAT